MHLTIYLLGSILLVALIGACAGAILAMLYVRKILREPTPETAPEQDAGITTLCRACGKHLSGPPQSPGRTVTHSLCYQCWEAKTV